MQGFNMGRYVPPDQEGLTTGNKLSGKHPLGARARHLHTTGALTVRFEMPFAVWCTTCQPNETLIGQGVRFNAEKKKIGNYYSTPIFSFRMRHPPCGGWIEIRTDPQNTAYVVAEGGRKRDTGETRELGVGEIAIKLPGEEGTAQPVDPFARLEGKVEDKRKSETETSRILKLEQRQRAGWEDPYENSRRLRRTFRAERKVRENADARSEALRDKMSLGIELVDEMEEDGLRAGMVDFGRVFETHATRKRPMFDATRALPAAIASGSGEKDDRKKAKKPKAAELVADRKAMLRSEVTGNTRAAIDPFLSHEGDLWRPETKKRKTVSNKGTPDMKKDDASGDSGVGGSTTPAPAAHAPAEEEPAESKQCENTTTALVDYGSDSD